MAFFHRSALNENAMSVIKRNVERRLVIESYAQYDCPKKGLSVPDLSTWDWSRADAIDAKMRCAGLKDGIAAGYLLWDQVELTLSDLRECAVVAGIFPGQPQKLGLIESMGGLVGWRPNSPRPWYDEITKGQALDIAAPMMLRPAVGSEAPASWYVEDGSGRAVAFVATKAVYNSTQTLATGYLGRTPDPGSTFMRRHFRELLPS